MLKKIESALFLVAEVMIIYAAYAGFFDYETEAYTKSFFLIVGLFLLVVFKNKYLHLDRFQQIIFIFSIITFFDILFKMMVFSGKGMNKDGFTLIGSLCLLLICNYWKPDKAWMYAVVSIGSVACLFFMYAYNINGRSWWGTSMTILGNNPQAVGVWSYILGCYQILMFDMTRSRIMKLINVFCVGYCIYISIMTETRTSSIVWILVIIMRVLPVMKFLLNKYVGFLLAFLPGIITFLGAFLWSHYRLDFMHGRFYIWSERLKEISMRIIIGDAVKYRSVYTHSAFLDVVLQFGLITTIFLFFIIAYSIYRRIKGNVNRLGYDAYILFAGALLVSCGESGMLLGGFGGTWFLVYSLLFFVGDYQREEQRGRCKLQFRFRRRMRPNVMSRKRRKIYENCTN